MLPFRPDRVHLVQEVPFTAQLVNHALLSNLSARLRPFNNIGLGFFDLGLSKFPLRHMLLQAFTIFADWPTYLAPLAFLMT